MTLAKSLPTPPSVVVRAQDGGDWNAKNVKEGKTDQDTNIMISTDASGVPAEQGAHQSLQDTPAMMRTFMVNSDEQQLHQDTSNSCGLTSTNYGELSAASDAKETTTTEGLEAESMATCTFVANQDDYCSPEMIDVVDIDASEEGIGKKSLWVDMFAHRADIIDNKLGARCSTPEPAQNEAIAWSFSAGDINCYHPSTASAIVTGVDAEQDNRVVVEQCDWQNHVVDEPDSIWPPVSCIDVGDCSDATTVAAAAAALAASVAAAVAGWTTEELSAPQEMEQEEPAQVQMAASRTAQDVLVTPTGFPALGEVVGHLPPGAVPHSDSTGVNFTTNMEYRCAKGDANAVGSSEEAGEEKNGEEGSEQRVTTEKVSRGAMRSSMESKPLLQIPYNIPVLGAAAGQGATGGDGESEQPVIERLSQDELSIVPLVVLRRLRPPVGQTSPSFLLETPLGWSAMTADDGCSTKKRDVVGRVSDNGELRRFSLRSRRPKIWFDEQGLVPPRTTNSTGTCVPNESYTASGRRPVPTAANVASTHEDSEPSPVSARRGRSASARLIPFPISSAGDIDVAAGASDSSRGAPVTFPGRYSLRLRPKASVEMTPSFEAIGASGCTTETRDAQLAPPRPPSIVDSGHFLRPSQSQNTSPLSHSNAVDTTPGRGNSPIPKPGIVGSTRYSTRSRRSPRSISCAVDGAEPTATIRRRMTATSSPRREKLGPKKLVQKDSGRVATVVMARPSSSMVVAQQVRKCGDAECQRRSSFGYPGDSRASRCVAHKMEGQEDITSRRCERKGCTRIPSFRHRGEHRSRFCAAHKEPGMDDYHKDTRFCIKSRHCGRTPSFGFKGGKRISCAAHKSEGMENLNITKCQGARCNVTPSFGPPGSSPTFCKKHKGKAMINLISRQCENQTCFRIPSYGWENGRAKAEFCAAHKVEGMVNVRHPRCAHGDCRRQPGFGKAKGLRGVYCKDHKKAGMVNLSRDYVKRKEHPKCCTQAGCQRQIALGNRKKTASVYCKEHKGAGGMHTKDGPGSKKARKR